jgi:WD40 repeat protein
MWLSLRSALVFADASTLCSGAYDKTVRVWDAASGTLRFALTEHTGSVCALDTHADRSLVVSGSYDHTIKLWDLRKSGRMLLL